MNLPPYAYYKDCEVEFFSKIPSHWIVWKVTHGFELIGSGTTPKSSNPAFYDGDTPWITTSELRENIVYDSKHMVSEQALKEYSTLKVYEPSSLAIAMYGATIGRIGILGVSATVNQACCVFDKPEQFDIKFFFYWLWMHRPTLISLSVGGGQPNLSQDDLKQLRVPAPPIPEQTQIAKFLDYKTAQIDRLIEKKKALIEKLGEQRIAMITQAVTKGLNPDAPMKDSEVDWLGKVPEHWGVTKFKYQVEFQEGPGIMGADFRDSGTPLARIRNVQSQYVDLEGCNYLDPDKVETRWPHFRCQLGDLIISGSASTGLISEINHDSVGAIVYTGLIRLWAIGQIEKEFIRWFVSSNVFFTQIDRFKTGSTIQHFGPEHLNQMLISLPPIEEQREICNHLESRLRQLDSMLAVNNKTIDKLNEYRTALITAAVTGKIDVREVKIPEQGAA